MSEPSAIQRLIRERRRGVSTLGMMVLLCAIPAMIAMTLYRLGDETLRTIVVAFQVLEWGVVAASLRRRFRYADALARAEATGLTTRVQVTLSEVGGRVPKHGPRHVWCAYAAVQRDGYLPDGPVWAEVADWKATQPWGMPLEATAYLDERSGEWMAIDTPNGTVFR